MPTWAAWLLSLIVIGFVIAFIVATIRSKKAERLLNEQAKKAVRETLGRFLRKENRVTTSSHAGKPVSCNGWIVREPYVKGNGIYVDIRSDSTDKVYAKKILVRDGDGPWRPTTIGIRVS
jgi:hypothetical protein